MPRIFLRSILKRRQMLLVGLSLALLFSFIPVTLAQNQLKTKITWFGHAAFKIETPTGGVILIDPWITNPKNPAKNTLETLTRVDYILVTHGHFDHVGEAVAIAKKTGAKLVASFGLGSNLVAMAGFPKEQAGFDTLGNIGGSIPLPKAGAKVTLVNAVHDSALKVANPAPGAPAVIESGSPVGFVLEIDNGPVIYHTGDTDVHFDMILTGKAFKVDVMLAAIGDHFTMGPARAAQAVTMVRPKVVIPMHYGTFPVLTGTPEELKTELSKGKRKRGSTLIVMKPGETRSF